MSTIVVPRSKWGARQAVPGGNKFSPPMLGEIVHWEADAPPATHDRCDDAVRAVQNYHMDRKGWNDIAYNAVACNHNYLYQGRVGGTAANGSNFANDHFRAVCWLGGPGHTPTPEALSAIAYFLQGGGLQVYPHSHIIPTQCPGDYLRAWIAAGHKDPLAGPTEPVGRWTWQEGSEPETKLKNRDEVNERLDIMQHDDHDRTLHLTHHVG